MKTFTSLKQIMKFENQQMNFQQMINGRACLKDKGYDDIKLSPELKKKICIKVVDIIGGYGSTQAKIYKKLMYERPQHRLLERFTVSKYGNSPEIIEYTSGQDMSVETKQLRNFLKR
tara:strand:+ start:2544 stop:2894 length:351 start_codon:yes stop_codon:yes gene_type:complete